MPFNLLGKPKIKYLLTHFEGDNVMGKLIQVTMHSGISWFVLVVENVWLNYMICWRNFLSLLHSIWTIYGSNRSSSKTISWIVEIWSHTLSQFIQFSIAHVKDLIGNNNDLRWKVLNSVFCTKREAKFKLMKLSPQIMNLMLVVAFSSKVCVLAVEKCCEECMIEFFKWIPLNPFKRAVSLLLQILE